jgi:hypothetical protein
MKAIVRMMRANSLINGGQKVRNRLMIGNIISTMKFCSIFLIISFINGGRYLFLKRRLKLIYGEYEEQIHKAIRGETIKFSTFLKEPLETGNDVLDLLLFKIHRSTQWFITLIFFYVISVAFFYLVFLL